MGVMDSHCFAAQKPLSTDQFCSWLSGRGCHSEDPAPVAIVDWSRNGCVVSTLSQSISMGYFLDEERIDYSSLGIRWVIDGNTRGRAYPDGFWLPDTARPKAYSPLTLYFSNNFHFGQGISSQYFVIWAKSVCVCSCMYWLGVDMAIFLHITLQNVLRQSFNEPRTCRLGSQTYSGNTPAST